MNLSKKNLIDGWVPDARLAGWAEKRDFGPARPMTDTELTSLHKEFRGKPAGLYLWEGKNSEVYIGISQRSVVTRLRQHMKDYPSVAIQCFRFIEDRSDSAGLRALEREMIYDLCRQEFTCFNREHSSLIHGKSLLDEVVQVADQKSWFEDPVGVNSADIAGGVPEASWTRTAASQARSKDRFDKLRGHPQYDTIVGVIATYLLGCILFPQKTQGDFWSLSCLPKTRLGGGNKRLVTLNLGMLEVLWINETAKGKLKVGVASDSTFLPARMTRFVLLGLGASMMGEVHRSAGPKAEYLAFRSPDAFMTALSRNPKIRTACARYALDRMRKGRVSGRYRDAHNVLLAEAALDRAGRIDLPTQALDRVVIEE